MSQEFLRVNTHHQRALPYCNRPLSHSAKEKASDAPRKDKHSKKDKCSVPLVWQNHTPVPPPVSRPRSPSPVPPPAITYPNACVRHFLPSTAGVTTNQERLSRTASSLTICHPVGFPPSAKFTSTHLTLNARSLKSDCITEQLCLFFFFPSLM